MKQLDIMVYVVERYLTVADHGLCNRMILNSRRSWFM